MISARKAPIAMAPGFFLTQTGMIDMKMLRGWRIDLHLIPPPL